MIISIAGASASGKSTMSKDLVNRLRKKGMEVALFEFDSYMVDRDKRKGSGSRPENIDLHRLYDDLQDLYFYKVPVHIRPYSHRLGRKIETIETIMPADTVIVDGSLSLMDDFVKFFRPYGIFIQTDIDTMNMLKVRENMDKRGYDLTKAIQNTIDDYMAYVDYIEPSIKNANRIIRFEVDKHGNRQYQDFM